MQKLKELLQFQTKAERLHRMDEFIDAMLEDNPDLTTRELNRMLRRQFCTHISQGRIAYGGDFMDLPAYMTETLYANDRQEWLKAHPQIRQVRCNSKEAVPQQPHIKQNLRNSAITKDGSRD